ncbi:hypothetical protein BDA99DRAFT_507220 [Phascolomyces articulosus]|uniref:Glutathione S-transferase n=1 Tax=Phascolomyces articulosus TaxID=60185 RepID=A0AAD5PGF2_9FUNG|nr:hypothetical protein BDA99DRAFT_507220 [Phascolomyces articulosus]
MAAELDNVKLYYFNYNLTDGVGEPIKLLLEDSQVRHQYIQIERTPDTWDNSFREELIASDKPYDCLPFIETQDGERYFCSGPILRFLSKKLGLLDGLSDKDVQFLDSVENLAFDFYISLAEHTVRPIVTEENRKKYITLGCRRHAARMERLYSIHDGPYALGSKVSYPDYVVYHTLYELRPILDVNKEFPNLAKLVDAIEKRPNIKEYIASRPQKNGPLEKELLKD